MVLDLTTAADWLCPDLRPQWRLRRNHRADCWVLQGRQVTRRIRFTLAEGFALARFSGTWTVSEIQVQCQAEFGETLAPDFVVQLLQRLLSLGILADDTPDAAPTDTISPPTQSMGLKPGARWTHQRDGHWILGDEAGLHHLQVSPSDKIIIDCIGQMPLAQIAQHCRCSPHQVKGLLNLLAQAELLTGVELPPPPQRKFTPLQLLYIKKPLFNPDRWLSCHVDKLGWLWGRVTTGLLGGAVGLFWDLCPESSTGFIAVWPAVSGELWLEFTPTLWTAVNDSGVAA
jgi:putative peptide zinc metalloprotease protein